MRLINLTNSTITVYDALGERVLFDLPTNPPAVRADFVAETVRTIRERDLVYDDSDVQIPVVRHTFDVDPDDLPEPEDGVVFVVGYAVLQALRGQRDDLVAPDTGRGSAVKDHNNHIIGVRRFRVL